jgi:hypothetical protein
MWQLRRANVPEALGRDRKVLYRANDQPYIEIGRLCRRSLQILKVCGAEGVSPGLGVVRFQNLGVFSKRVFDNQVGGEGPGITQGWRAAL